MAGDGVPTSFQIEDLRFRRRNVNDCAWASYDEASVVYHRPSGLTHLLNPASVYLLTDVLVEARSFDEVVDSFVPEGEQTDPQQFREQIMEILMRLEYFGLLETVAS